jgi:hypothetical protein
MKVTYGMHFLLPQSRSALYHHVYPQLGQVHSEQGLFWGPKATHIVKKLSTFHRALRFIAVLTRICQWALILIQLYTVHIFIPYLFKIHFNIILLSSPEDVKLIQCL